MKWVGVAAILAVLLIAAGAGLWLYRGAIERDIADIKARLVSDKQLAEPEQPETASAIKLAPLQCERVFDLRASTLARVFAGEELDSLWRRCQRIADIASGLDKIERQSLPP